MPSATSDRRRGLTGDKGIKAPVDLATTGQIALFGEQVVDGVQTNSSRVLVWQQTTKPVDNGLYDSSSGSWTRCIDANGNQDFANGTLVLVAGGFSKAGHIYRCTSEDNPLVIGSSNLTFTESLAPSGSAAAQEDEVTATAGQKVFDFPTLRYQPGVMQLELFADGILLNYPDDYAQNSDRRVTTAVGMPDGTVLQARAVVRGDQVVDLVVRGPNSAVPGSVMAIKNLIEDTAAPYLLQSEGGAWSAGTYTFFGISKEFTAATVNDQGNGTLTGGPLANLFAFANNNGAGGDVVAVLGDAVARQSNGSVFGANFIARNEAGTTGAKLVGLEIDLEPAVGTTISAASIGLAMNVFSIATAAPAILLGSVGGGTWGNGFITLGITGTHLGVSVANTTTAQSFINTRYGLFTAGAIVLGTGASQSVHFGPDGFGSSPLVYGDSSGNIGLQLGSTNGLLVMDKTGAVITTLTASRVTFTQALSATVAAVGNFADDTAAAAGSVPVGGIYRTGSALKMRVA